jgi:hypothetical protein
VIDKGILSSDEMINPKRYQCKRMIISREINGKDLHDTCQRQVAHVRIVNIFSVVPIRNAIGKGRKIDDQGKEQTGCQPPVDGIIFFDCGLFGYGSY